MSGRAERARDVDGVAWRSSWGVGHLGRLARCNEVSGRLSSRELVGVPLFWLYSTKNLFSLDYFMKLGMSRPHVLVLRSSTKYHAEGLNMLKHQRLLQDHEGMPIGAYRSSLSRFRPFPSHKSMWLWIIAPENPGFFPPHMNRIGRSTWEVNLDRAP